MTFRVRWAYAAALRPRSHLTLAPRQRAEIRHRPVQADQAQKALDEPGRLSKRHPEQHLHGQAGLDGGIAVVGLPPALAGWHGFPGHGGIEPDRQRAPALQRLVVGRPVPGLVRRGCGSAHTPQLSRWIHDMNPVRRFVQQSRLEVKSTCSYVWYSTSKTADEPLT